MGARSSSLLAAALVMTLAGTALAQPHPPGPGLPPPPLPGGPAFVGPPGPPGAPGRLIRVQVVAVDATTLGSPMAGHILRIGVRDGERFEKGQELVAFDCRLEEARLARARAAVAKARAVADAKQRLDKLGSVSQVEVAVAAAEVKEAEADVQLTEAAVGRCRVLAPFPGRVGGVEARAHQHVAEGQPLLNIHDDRKLEVDMILPSRWLSWLSVGYHFDVQMDETGKRYTVEVSRISGQVDAASQSVRVYASIRGNADGLLPGMSGRALLDPPAN